MVLSCTNHTTCTELLKLSEPLFLHLLSPKSYHCEDSMIMQLKYLPCSLACSKCSVNINSSYLPCRQTDTKFESYTESS